MEGATAPLLRPPPEAAECRFDAAAAAAAAEERRIDWGYSRPFVALDLAWNLAFLLVSASVLFTTAKERPSTPLRAWVVGYAVQCLLHVGVLGFEHRRRRGRGRWTREEEGEELDASAASWAVKKLDSLNAMVALLWWILGFYWIVVGGQALLQDAPRLYWVAVVFLAFDVFFAIFCTLACIIGMALFCCLPCIIAFLYAVSGQEGASDVELSDLPKFQFRRPNRSESFDVEREHSVSITIAEQNTCKSIDELELSPDDSECCICLSRYRDGAELHSLPCNHHFHSGCIVKWLRINATCPLCKHNIRRSDEHV